MKCFTKNTGVHVIPIKGYELRYAISNEGDVISTIKSGGDLLEGIKLKPDMKDKYSQVWLYDGFGGRKRFLVHRLVALHFISNPLNLEAVNHIDKNHHNNCSLNLEWVSVGRNNEHSSAKYYNLISPEGERVTIYNMNKFCRENDLNQGNMSMVATGRLLSCMGWRSAEANRENVKMRRFNIKSPDGVIHSVLNSSDFCNRNGLSKPKISMLRNGKIKSHKGWRLA